MNGFKAGPRNQPFQELQAAERKSKTILDHVKLRFPFFRA